MPVPLVEYDLLDCAIDPRIGPFISDNRDIWFPYGNSREDLERTLEDNVRVCLAAFGEAAQRWADPAFWLSNPTVQSLRPWVNAGTDLRLFKALISAHLGKLRETEETLTELVATARSSHYREWYETLLRSFREKGGM